MAADPCRADGAATPVLIDTVIDGDTVVLQDGRKVRLIGIDTPELGYNGAPSQAFSQRAKAALRDELEHSAAITAIPGTQPTDRYGRRLMHLFRANGANIQAMLVRRGLATRLTIPPNLRFLDCYANAESDARRHSRGIWSLHRFRPIAVHRLTGQERGFYRIRGRIDRISESASSIWLNLGPGFALRLVREDLAYFSTFDPRALTGQRVTASGMVYQRGAQMRMRIRHPANLEMLGQIQ